MIPDAGNKATISVKDRETVTQADYHARKCASTRDEAISERGLSKKQVLQEFNCVVVANASLQVRRGEIFCVMGLSGSGRSTLIRLLNRLIEPSLGKITVKGKKIAKLSVRRSARLPPTFKRLDDDCVRRSMGMPGGRRCRHRAAAPRSAVRGRARALFLRAEPASRALVTDAVESTRQCVEQEAANELVVAIVMTCCRLSLSRRALRLPACDLRRSQFQLTPR